MRKKLFFVFALLLLFSAVFSVSALASEGDELIREFEDSVPDSALTEDGGLPGVEELGMDKLVEQLFSAIGTAGQGALSFFLFVFGFAVILAAGEGISSGAGTPAAISVVSSVAIFSRLMGMLYSVREGLVSVCGFFGSVIPIAVAINAGSGMTATSGVSSVNMSLILAGIEKLSVDFLLPVAFSSFALSLSASTGDKGVASVSRGMKNLFAWGVGIVSTVASSTVAIQTLVASAKDNAALRAARYAASGTIPVVGSTVASAISTLAGGMAYARSTVGAGAIAVILSLSLIPLLTLLLYRLAFSVCILFLEFSGCEYGSRAYTAHRSSLDSVIAVYAMSVLLVIIEMIIFLKSGGDGW